METEELVLRARAGDRNAFDRLMVLYQRLVMGTVVRLLRDVEDARDAAQEVFLKLFRNLARIKASVDLRPWLYRVTVNVCRDTIKKRRGYAASTLEEDQGETPTPAPSLLTLSTGSCCFPATRIGSVSWKLSSGGWT